MSEYKPTTSRSPTRTSCPAASEGRSKNNNKMQRIIILLLIFVVIQQSHAQPLRELRGVWISTVKMLDYPSKRNLTSEQLKQEFISIVDTCQALGMNAIFFQIRPAADAFFQSPYEPWSEWLTGKQGRPPKPYFDPLKFMIDETHKRNMRFYAWINPFRAIATIDFADVSPKHITKRKPQWFFDYGKHRYFNPGIPEVRNYLTKIIIDVVKRYDVDAIVFDDYFYPYPERDNNGKIIPIPDNETFRKYGKGFSNIKDWRRNNINLFIEQVSKAIKNTKPWVIFGISPPAVWRNKSRDTAGSATRGLAAYDWLYADPLTWLKNGWIDFVSPQLYYYIGHKYADYKTLLDWWKKHTYGRNMYISLNVYNLEVSKDKHWRNPEELPTEIKMARQVPQVKGFIFYRFKPLNDNPLGIKDSLRSHYFSQWAFYPRLPYIDSIPPEPPSYIGKYRIGKEITVYWEPKDTSLSPMDTIAFYVVYRFKGRKPGKIGSRDNIYLITREPEFTVSRKHKFQLFGKTYTFVITAFDRFHNESKPTKPIRIKFSKNE